MPHSKPIVVLRGIISNLFAKSFPATYFRLVGETGRGRNHDDVQAVEGYSVSVFQDYTRMLSVSQVNEYSFLKDKTVLEYGPGDFLGVALLFYLHGAKRLYCIDRFPLKNDPKYLHIYDNMMHKYSRIGKSAKWPDILGKNVVYTSTKDGIFEIPEKADLIISRAVLEHCNNLEKTFENMCENLKPGGLMIHKVDLTSHGTHVNVPLDFLCYSRLTWFLMTGAKGYPNRWRVNHYKKLLQDYRFQIHHEEYLNKFSEKAVQSLRPMLAKEFRSLPDKDLLCSDYFFVAAKMA